MEKKIAKIGIIMVLALALILSSLGALNLGDTFAKEFDVGAKETSVREWGGVSHSKLGASSNQLTAQAVTPPPVWGGPTDIASKFAGGDGSETTPYLISNGAELAYLAQRVNDSSDNNHRRLHYKLTADIVLNDISGWESWNGTNKPTNTWTPIGNTYNSFLGTFDGDSHTVSGIYISGIQDLQGLFGAVGQSDLTNPETATMTVKNVGVINSFIKGGRHVGGVAGMTFGAIINCYNKGNVSGDNINVGGVVGWNNIVKDEAGTVIRVGTTINCYNTGNVSSSKYSIGGVVGNSAGAIINCYNTGAVSGADYTGGVVGYGNIIVAERFTDALIVLNCYNTGSVSGTNNDIGGVIGYTNFSDVANCYNTGAVKGNGNVGGVAGENIIGRVLNCYNYGAVSGTASKYYGVGGVVGRNEGSSSNKVEVDNCYFLQTNDINVGLKVCGINGTNSGDLNCSSFGTDKKLTTASEFYPNSDNKVLVTFAAGDGLKVTLTAGAKAYNEKNPTLKIKASPWVYNGNTYPILGFWVEIDETGITRKDWTGSGVTYEITGTHSGIGDFVLEYKKRPNNVGDPFIGTAPSEVGAYDVKITRPEKGLYAETSTTIAGGLVINKATNSITKPVLTGWEYGAMAKTPTATATHGTVIFTYSDAENGTYSSKAPTNAGTYWVKASVTETNNYRGAEAKTSFTITPAVLTVTTSPITKEYDGNNTANVALVVGGLKNDETATAVGTATFADATVGSGKTITVTGITIKYVTATATNYTYTQVNITTTGEITRNAIDRPTVVAGVLIYNGKAQDGVSAANGFTYSGATSEINAGTYKATATLDGNHIWSTADVGGSVTNAVELTWTIAKKAATVATNAATKIYGAENPTWEVTLSNFEATDSVTATDFDIASSATKFSPIGEYDIAVSGKTAETKLSNYDITYNTTNKLAITAKPITITIDDKTSAFGVAPARLTWRDVDYGIVNSDDLKIKLTKVIGTDVGTYNITGACANTNYSVTFINTANTQAYGVYTITQATNTWTSNLELSPTTWTYGDAAGTLTTPTATFGTVGIKYYKTSDPTAFDVMPSNAGAYSVTATVEGTTNYTALTATVSFTITPKELTISGITANNKTYDGNTTATLVMPTITNAMGLVGTDVVTVTATGAFENADVVENKTVNISDLTLVGANAGNYVLKAVGQQDKTTATISLATIGGTISATNYSAPYDAQSHGITVDTSLAVVVNSQPITITYCDTELGTYVSEIKIKDYTPTAKTIYYKVSAPNHTPIIQSATITITQAQVIPTWVGNGGAFSWVYDGQTHSPSATVAVVAGSGDACKVTVEVANNKKDVGEYTATAVTLDNLNYVLSGTVTQKFTIAARPITITWGGFDSRVYDGKDSAVTATAGSLVLNESLPLTVAGGTANTAGTHTATASMTTADPNYSLPAVVTQQYVITRKGIAVPTTPPSVGYTGAEQSDTIGNNLLTLTTDSLSATISGNTVTAKDKGDYTIKINLRDSINYCFGADSGTDVAEKTVTWSITKQQVEKPVASGSYKYNGNAQTLTMTNSTDTRFTIAGNTQTDVGDYTATVTLNDTANFEWKDGTITPLNFSWSIAKATPTVSVTSINDVVYGTIGNLEYNFTTVKDGVTTKNYIYTATGVDADSATFGGTIAVTYTAKSGEKSTAEKLKVGAYTASWTFTPNNTTNYESVSGTQSFKVTPIAIAPTIKTAGATAIEKEYDKTADATVVAGDVVLGGLIFSDDVALTFTATYDNKNVGANKAVTVHYTAITGADIDNYSLTGGDLTGYTGAITAKELTATWGKNAFTYNGTPQAPTATLTAIAGDTITYAVTGAETNANPTGVIPIATVAFNGTGADNGNYTIKNSKQHFTIAQKAVTVAQKAGSTLTKIYDGNNNCDTTFAKDTQYEIIGVEETDKASLDITISSKVFDDPNISATKVTATFILNDYGKTNYSCEAKTFEHTATITPIKLTITKAPEAQQLSKAYDGLKSFAVSNIQESDYVVTRTDNGEFLPKEYSLNVQSVEFESNAISAVMGKDNVTVTMAKTNDVGGTNLNRNFELSNTTFKMDGRIVNSDAQAGTDYIVTLNNGITGGTSGTKDGVTYASDKVTFAVGAGKYDKIRKTATDTWADSIEFTENATSIAFQLKKKGVEEFEIVVVLYGIDKADPTIANEKVIDIDVVGENGFFKDNFVKVSFDVADIGSGIAKIELKKGVTIVTRTLSDGVVVYEIEWAENNPINDTYVLTITDYAGRTATVTLVVDKHDNVAPTIADTIDGKAIDYTKWVGVGKIDFTLSDATSGIKTKVWTADGSLGATVADTFSHTFVNGHHSFKLVLTDNAGNSTTLEKPLLVDNNIATFMTEYNKFDSEATGAEKDKKAAALNALFEGYTVTQKEHITGKDSSNAEADTAYKALQTYITGRKSQIEAERISQETERVKAEITAIMGKNPIPQSDLENFVKQLPISKEVEGKLTPEQKQHIVDIVAVEKVVDLLNAKPNNNAQLENWLKTYNALTETQKTLAQKAVETLAERNTTYVGYKTAVDELIAGAKDLNSVNATNKDKIDALIAKYNALTAVDHLPSGINSKALVPQNVAAKIEKWIASIAKATAVDGKIGAIGGVPTDYTKEFNNKVVDAEKAYSELTADEKTLVANAKTLEDAKKANDELKKKLATSDKAAAEVADFESKFVEFPAKPTIKDVLEIYEKYEKLSTEAKAILDATTKTNLDAWKTAADAVFGKDDNSKIINRIENIDLKKLENATAEEIATIKAEIESVITEYGKLSGQQKDLVDNTVGGKCDKLADLKARLDAAEKAIKDIPKENADGNHDCGLCNPGSGTGHDTDSHQNLIEKAKIAYEKLSAIERKLLNSDSVTTMETQYEILKDYLSKLAQQKIIKDKADKEDVSVYGLATLVDTSTVPDITIADTIVISVDAKKTDTEMTDMDEDQQKVVSFDVKLMAKAGNNEAVQIQPKENQKVVVKLALGQIYAHEKIQIYHNKNDGSRELVQNVNFIDEGNQTYAIFETSSFSEFFALTEKSNEIYVPDSDSSGSISGGAIFDKSIENEIRYKDTNPVIADVSKQENTLSKSILDAIKDAESGKVITVIFKEGEISITKEKLKGIVIDKKSYTYAELKALLETPEIIPTPTPTPTEKPTEPTEPTAKKCWLCGVCPMFLGLCLWIWLAIAIVAAAVVVIIVVKKKKKGDDKTKKE